MSNPFTLETDNKKFFTGLANSALDTIYENPTAEDHARRIRNMNDQLNELAKKRQQMLFKESQMDMIFKKQKPLTNLNDFVGGVPQGGKNDRKFRVRALLKEKKQSMHDFLNKKKEIYLSKMNINIKKEETGKLEDYIRDEEETLKARKLYFENDVEFMHRFIDGIKKQAEQAQTAVEAQLKQQQILVSKLNALEAQIQKVDNQISKDEEILQNLELYQKFIDGLYDPDRNWKPYAPKKMVEEVLFMTQNQAGPVQDKDGMGLVIKYQPENMIEIFNDAEESNIREIQNLQEKQAELEMISKQELQSKTSLETLIKENEERIAVLQKNCEKKLQNCQRLKELRKANNSKVSVSDDENLDLEKVSNRIFQIYKDVNPKRSIEVEKQKNEGQMKRQMTEIQQQIERLRISIKQGQEARPDLIPDIEKQIKAKQRRQNQIRKQEENKQLELKKQLEQEKKRNQTQNEKAKGRKDMEKVLIEKKVKKKKQVNLKDVDDSDKYLKEEQAL